MVNTALGPSEHKHSLIVFSQNAVRIVPRENRQHCLHSPVGESGSQTRSGPLRPRLLRPTLPLRRRVKWMATWNGNCFVMVFVYECFSVGSTRSVKLRVLGSVSDCSGDPFHRSVVGNSTNFFSLAICRMSSVIFIEQYFGPHMLQKWALLNVSCGKVSSW